jgi:endoglucanase
MPYKLLSICIFFIGCASTPREIGSQTDSIRLNQIGFYPNANKIAVVLGTNEKQFFIMSADLKERVFEGELSAVRTSTFSDKKTQIADFSEFKNTGVFVVVVPGAGHSHQFEIKDAVHTDIAKASLKAFYYQRFSTSLPESFAGKWNRPFSHPDNKVLIHASAASKNRPRESVISTPRGWIDAGDYNKYIVNSGITMGTLLSAYEDFSGYYQNLNTNIPESKNELPDIVDECLWNLRWMLTMQDPDDGGVYHKCTNASFDPMVMPHEAITPRYVVQKGTAATLDFAAVTAQASRILKSFETQLPGLADSCLRASKNAWKWASANPEIRYDQDQLNKTFDPDITTGGYGDGKLSDEWVWAACELAVTTGDPSYMENIKISNLAKASVPSWSDVEWLGFYTLLRHRDKLPIQSKIDSIQTQLLMKADKMIAHIDQHYYMTLMGADSKDFVWGSNAVAGNQGILLLQAYAVSKEKKYFNAALSNLDYLLGRNATGYSFLTGYGDKTPMHIHHRPSEADNIPEPVPGLLAGGPNPGMQDKCSYQSSIPDEAYVDHVCSYASNEVAINWNAPLVYLAGAIEAYQTR